MVDRKIEELASSYNPGIKLKVEQLDALISLACGNDTIVSLPALPGYGKSLIYHLLPQDLGSSVVKPVVVVISPLNVIQKDQLSTLRQHGVSACRLDINTCICETTDMSEVSLSTVAEVKYSLIFGHPETLFQTEKGRGLLRNEVLSQRVVAIVIDEVHIIEKWYKLHSLATSFSNSIFSVTKFGCLCSLKGAAYSHCLVLLSFCLVQGITKNYKKYSHQTRWVRIDLVGNNAVCKNHNSV